MADKPQVNAVCRKATVLLLQAFNVFVSFQFDNTYENVLLLYYRLYDHLLQYQSWAIS